MRSRRERPESCPLYTHPQPPAGERFGVEDRRAAPHVDDVAGRLVYVLPVTSGTARTPAFDIREADLRVLLAAPDRRAVLEARAERMLQRASIRRKPEVTPAMFRDLLDQVLHAPRADLATSNTRFDRG
ncbi:hypothetical protein LK533_14650 [Sphingomonas sp. PL-96]|uniref:hypothetical protein n=1 Tax=Sphingomonas sp. PL-96 TaxID=2887201 RepID=UPI001E28EC04|nr:hypothetical protein [Sphingomonas sp. PL-96]MCC2977912.1 hypothetical protein [Sphingomonas sp. PL-96]